MAGNLVPVSDELVVTSAAVVAVLGEAVLGEAVAEAEAGPLA